MRGVNRGRLFTTGYFRIPYFQQLPLWLLWKEEMTSPRPCDSVKLDKTHVFTSIETNLGDGLFCEVDALMVIMNY